MPPPPATPPAAPSESEGYAKSRETRARILAAALAEAGETGFHKTSVARIAARAGVAVGSLHYHFGSRDELLRELMTEQMAGLMQRLYAADTEAGVDFFERQRSGMLAYLDHLRAHPTHVRLSDEIKLHDPDLYRRGVADWVERMAGWIRAGIAEGSVRPMDDEEIAAQAHFLVGARHFLEQLRDAGDGPDDEVVVDAYLGLVRDGLGRRGNRRKKTPAASKPARRKRR